MPRIFPLRVSSASKDTTLAPKSINPNAVNATKDIEKFRLNSKVYIRCRALTKLVLHIPCADTTICGLCANTKSSLPTRSLVCHDPFGEFPTSFNFANKEFSTADMVSQSVVMLAIKYRTFPRTLE